MSDVQVPVLAPKELNDVLGAAVDLIIAAKWGQLNAVAQLGVFVGLIGEFSAIPAEISETGPVINCASIQLARLINGLITKPA
jgi:hypothetical protein